MNHSSRIGKIARLPRRVREKLNVRLEEGESAEVLLEWLNSLPVTREIVEEYFEGRLITEQNLSVWRQGGFVEWQRNQERRALMREFLSEGEELHEELGRKEGEGTFADRLAQMVALELAVLLREAMKMECGERRRKAVLEIARELDRLRRGDHREDELWLKQERWEIEREEKAEAKEEEMKVKIARKENETRVYAAQLRERYEEAQAAGTLNPQWAAKVREYFVRHGKNLKECGVPEWVPPGDNRPVEQRQSGAAMGIGGASGLGQPQAGIQSESK